MPTVWKECRGHHCKHIITNCIRRILIRWMQLDDKCLGELLQAKESSQKPLQDYSWSQSPEYRWLYQQWDQLIVREGVLWRYYAQPNEKTSWFQLIVPQPLRSDIVKEGGHLGQEKTIHRVKQRFYWCLMS